MVVHERDRRSSPFSNEVWGRDFAYFCSFCLLSRASLIKLALPVPKHENNSLHSPLKLCLRTRQGQLDTWRWFQQANAKTFKLCSGSPHKHKVFWNLHSSNAHACMHAYRIIQVWDKCLHVVTTSLHACMPACIAGKPSEANMNRTTGLT